MVVGLSIPLIKFIIERISQLGGGGRGGSSSSCSIFDPDQVLLNRRGGLGIGPG